MRARQRHYGRELGNELDVLELHVSGAVLPQRLELVAHPALRRDRQSLLRNRRARDVPAQALGSGWRCLNVLPIAPRRPCPPGTGTALSVRALATSAE